MACSLAVTAHLLGLSIGACGRPPPTGPDENLLLISVDTLRADHLGAYGYPLDTSPNIDRLAREGVLFRNAYSQAGWTTPSMATLMTGLFPDQHGAVRFDTPIPDTIETLAEVLGAAGYETHAHVSHVLVDEKYGFDQGFDTFDFYVLRHGHPGQVSTSEELTNRAIRGIEDLEEPYFLWLHYMDPHQIYLEHEGFRFPDSKTPRYDSEIAHNDYQIGRLLDSLDDRELLDRTLIVFAADHGEELGEHDSIGHFTLHDEVLQIPLIIRSTTTPAEEVDRPVSQVDILPTVLSLLGLTAEPRLSGHDVLAASSQVAPIFAERIQPNAYWQRSVRAGDYKLIQIEPNPSPAENDLNFEYDKLAKLKAGVYLYDVARDPFETRNLLEEREAQATALLWLLEAHSSGIEQPDDTIPLAAAHEAALRSLGYIK